MTSLQAFNGASLLLLLVGVGAIVWIYLTETRGDQR